MSICVRGTPPSPRGLWFCREKELWEPWWGDQPHAQQVKSWRDMDKAFSGYCEWDKLSPDRFQFVQTGIHWWEVWARGSRWRLSGALYGKIITFPDPDYEWGSALRRRRQAARTREATRLVRVSKRELSKKNQKELW